MTITSELFEAYLECPTKCWLRSQGETDGANAYANWTRAKSQTYRSKGIENLIEWVPQNERAIAPSIAENPKAAKWRMGVDLLARKQDLESRLHAVERIPSEGRGKAAQFIPTRFIFTNKLGKNDKLLLAFDAFVLAEALGREIAAGKIIHGDDHATLKVKTSALAGEVRKRIERIASLLSSLTPPDLVLKRHCAECEFQAPCRQKAMEKDDLSLLAGMSEKERKKLHSKGIFTVTQMSYTFRPRRTPKRAKNPAKPRYLALQALAIRENTVYIHGTPTLPQAKTEVYLDIEGLPDRDFYYLIGALIVSHGHEVFRSFWADTQSDEPAIFTRLAEAVSQLDDFRIFHFGDYDAVALKRMKSRLSEHHQTQIDMILGKCTNTLSAIYPHVYFPTFSNNLKDICEHLGDNSPGIRATGLESIVWRNEWEKGSDGNLKARLVDYNRSDCLALRRLTDFIAAQTVSPVGGEKNHTKVRRTDDMNRTRPRWRMFAQREYALKDLEHVTKCSYFDYQREKVLVRTDNNLREVNKKHRKFQRTKSRPNKIIELQVKKCVLCKSRKITPRQVCERLLFDLKFSKGGVKRWITKTKFPRYYCSKCGRDLIAWNGEPNPSKYGHSLVSWCIYWHVIGGLNMRRVNRSLGDFFGLFIPEAESHRFKTDMKAIYEPLYAEIQQVLLRGPILHVDETSVNLRGESGYVWVLASTDKVYFFYRPSREGDFLGEMLAPFRGILISDFFTAYDAVPCRQQKCLAHLVREIDEDLFRNPLDTELKQLAQYFGTLLKGVVGTIDRYGLKRRHLQKHKREARRFLEAVTATDVNSELANKYKKRFQRSGTKMFTFLDYDGVPWNNNNAEHAIKFFAKFRQHANGRFTESSLRDYLVLASVFTTCEFNNVNPLKFLLSKENTLDGLLRMARQKTNRSHQPRPEGENQARPDFL
jgi:predicted RecB family nuclease